METSLAQYLSFKDNAAEALNQRKQNLYTGPFHPIEKLINQRKQNLYSGPFHPIEKLDKCSPSEVVNESSEETGVSVPEEHKDAFDKVWREALSTIFTKAGDDINKELLEFEKERTSNGHPLGLQVMILNPGMYFKVHAHPNIEFEYTMLGTLKEFRWPDLKQPAQELKRERSATEKPVLTGPDIAATQCFEERSVAQNECMLNETGSVHQSFTGPKEACAILVLWSGCHANTHPSHVFNKDPRLRPSAGWPKEDENSKNDDEEEEPPKKKSKGETEAVAQGE